MCYKSIVHSKCVYECTTCTEAKTLGLKLTHFNWVITADINEMTIPVLPPSLHLNLMVRKKCLYYYYYYYYYYYSTTTTFVFQKKIPARRVVGNGGTACSRACMVHAPCSIGLEALCVM